MYVCMYVCIMKMRNYTCKNYILFDKKNLKLILVFYLIF